MSGFKGSLESEWLFRQEVRLFGNFMRNWQGEVEDSDFFILFGDDGGEEKSLAKAMLLKHYSREELEECDLVWVRDRNGDEKPEIDLRRGVKNAVAGVWNHFGKAGRERCRAMLEEWLAEVVKRHGRGRTGRRKDALEGRVDEVCKVLSLGETERDLLVYAMVRQMTEFDDFPLNRHGSRHGERGTWLAMAVDRPCGAVAKALSGEEKLRKYEVMDGDGY